MTEAASRAFLVVVAVIGLTLRTIFLLYTPIDQPESIGILSSYGDERAHVEYTLHILRTGYLPRTSTAITIESVVPAFENYQSPLYYLLHAGVCKALGVESVRDVTLCGRALSLLFGVLILWIAWKILKLMGGVWHSTEWAVIFTCLALSGVLVRFSTLAGNDAFFWLCSGFCCYSLLKLPNDRNARTLTLLLLCLVCAFYVKLSALLLLPSVVFQVVRSRTDTRLLLPLALAAVVLLSPLFLRNLRDFGSLLPLASGFGESGWRLPNFDSLFYAIRSGVFPWNEVWNNWLGLALMLPALAVFSAVFVKWLRRPALDWHTILLGSALLAYVILNLQYDQAEARYLFVAWPVILPSVFAQGRRSKLLPYAAAVSFCLPYALFLG
jgi:hypothetical protein